MTIHLSADLLDLSAYVRSGDHIVWGQACGEPGALIETLIAQADRIGPVSAFAATSFSPLLPRAAGGNITINSMGAIGTLRTLAAQHQLGVIPCHVGQVATMIEQGQIGCDVAFVQVSPADADGNHSFGLIADFVAAAVAKARVVIAEINDQIPYTHCNVMLAASDIDVAIKVSRPPVEAPVAPIGPQDQAIAQAVANYVADGAVIQVGVGAAPDAILRLLQDRRDLGVHSGMIGDGLVDLVEAGVVTNARKEIDRGVSITGALIGTSRLYQFANRNPAIGMRDSSYTHNEAVLSRLSRLITINSAIEVDLTGQVNAEQAGDKYVGGSGGQVDFVRAGARSRGGRAIIALQATAKGGDISRIVPHLSGPVTTARSEVDVIVTEFGAAELKGQTLAQRARRLIDIAHPRFRDELDRAAHDVRRRGF